MLTRDCRRSQRNVEFCPWITFGYLQHMLALKSLTLSTLPCSALHSSETVHELQLTHNTQHLLQEQLSTQMGHMHKVVCTHLYTRPAHSAVCSYSLHMPGSGHSSSRAVPGGISRLQARAAPCIPANMSTNVRFCDIFDAILTLLL